MCGEALSELREAIAANMERDAIRREQEIYRRIAESAMRLGVDVEFIQNPSEGEGKGWLTWRDSDDSRPITILANEMAHSGWLNVYDFLVFNPILSVLFNELNKTEEGRAGCDKVLNGLMKGDTKYLLRKADGIFVSIFFYNRVRIDSDNAELFKNLVSAIHNTHASFFSVIDFLLAEGDQTESPSKASERRDQSVDRMYG